MAYLWLLLLLLLHKVSCLLLWLWPWHHHVVGLHWPGNPLLLLPGLSVVIVLLFDDMIAARTTRSICS